MKPTMKYADIIVPRGRSDLKDEQNKIAIDFIVSNLEHHLIKAGYDIETRTTGSDGFSVYCESEQLLLDAFCETDPRLRVKVASSDVQ